MSFRELVFEKEKNPEPVLTFMPSPQSSLLPSPIPSKHQAVTFQIDVDLLAFYCMQSMHVCLKMETEVVNVVDGR